MPFDDQLTLAQRMSRIGGERSGNYGKRGYQNRSLVGEQRYGQARQSGFYHKGVGKTMAYNRPSSSELKSGFVKPSINYGSVVGQSAKFYGQGIMTIRRPKRAPHPFLVDVRKKTNTQDYEYYVQTGLIGNIPGLGSNTVTSTKIEDWSDMVPPPARIYLEVTINDLEITAITTGSMAEGAEFEKTVITNAQQNTARISLATYSPETPGEEDYRVVQNVRTDILTPIFCYNGFPCLFLAQEFASAYAFAS